MNININPYFVTHKYKNESNNNPLVKELQQRWRCQYETSQLNESKDQCDSLHGKENTVIADKNALIVLFCSWEWNSKSDSLYHVSTFMTELRSAMECLTRMKLAKKNQMTIAILITGFVLPGFMDIIVSNLCEEKGRTVNQKILLFYWPITEVEELSRDVQLLGCEHPNDPLRFPIVTFILQLCQGGVAKTKRRVHVEVLPFMEVETVYFFEDYLKEATKSIRVSMKELSRQLNLSWSHLSLAWEQRQKHNKVGLPELSTNLEGKSHKDNDVEHSAQTKIQKKHAECNDLNVPYSTHSSLGKLSHSQEDKSIQSDLGSKPHYLDLATPNDKESSCFSDKEDREKKLVMDRCAREWKTYLPTEILTRMCRNVEPDDNTKSNMKTKTYEITRNNMHPFSWINHLILQGQNVSIPNPNSLPKPYIQGIQERFGRFVAHRTCDCISLETHDIHTPEKEDHHHHHHHHPLHYDDGGNNVEIVEHVFV